ncbi:MAG: branched-chain amino acid ABC transporter permease [Candidatus Odinarchaeota archaeon]
MKTLSNIIDDDFFQAQKGLIVGLIILFTTFLLFPFFTQNSASNAIQVIILGAVASAQYAVLAVGFSLIYGVAKQLKLSLGGYYVVGAYTMYFLLETMDITPSLSLFSNIDGLILLVLVLLPIILMIVLLVFFWTVFDRREFIFLLVSPITAGGSIILFGGNIVQSFYAGIAVLTLSLAAWYLEFPRREVAIGTFIISATYPFLNWFGLSTSYISLMILSIMFTALLAMFADRYLLDRFRASHVNTMIVTFALALLYQSIIQIFYFPVDGNHIEQFGPEDRTLQTIFPKKPVGFLVDLFGVYVDNVRITSLILSIFICLLLYAFIWFSKMGMALRAVSQDEEAAALAGINIRKITAIVSGLGMGLIAFASILTSPFSAMPIWFPFMGWWALIMAIVVVTLGGMGSLPGSIIAAFIIGYLEVIIGSVPVFAPFSIVIPFIIILMVLIFKPEGLLGEKKELEG